ncbi:MAG: AMP-binding protein, partial [Algicola sp.]|nr:AMP-binding protein [Algicola sp.]
WELWWANPGGATIVMAEPYAHKPPALINDLMLDAGITVLHFVPSMLGAFCDYLSQNDESLPAGVKQVFCSGEALTLGNVKDFRVVSDERCNLINLYGPTEAAIDVTHFDTLDIKNNKVAIGRAIDNIRLYVLDENGQPVPVGCCGELHIGGMGLARGYLNREALTRETFIDNAFATETDKLSGYSKLYKTGDLVRWLPDGNVEYLGRKDSQVKIRGFRVELGEIQSALTDLLQIKQATVIDYEHNQSTILAAYIVSETGEPVALQVLRNHLLALLPEYMVPTTFNLIDALPLTLNGKLDRKALPAPQFDGSDNYVAPVSLLEKNLCALWQKTLKIDRVGTTDNFFLLGGNSIIAIYLSGIAQRELGLDMPIGQLLEHQTVGELAVGLVGEVSESVGEFEEYDYPLSFAQQRALFAGAFE